MHDRERPTAPVNVRSLLSARTQRVQRDGVPFHSKNAQGLGRVGELLSPLAMVDSIMHKGEGYEVKVDATKTLNASDLGTRARRLTPLNGRDLSGFTLIGDFSGRQRGKTLNSRC